MLTIRGFLGAFLITFPVLAQAPTIGSCAVFPADNVWNTPIDKLPLAANSASFVTTIGPAKGLKADFGAGLWDGGPIGIPFVTVAGTQTKYPATFLYRDESDNGPYAVPLNAPIEGGPGATGDRHALAIDTTNCILYELYRAFPLSTSWQGDSGAIFDLRSHALRPATWTSADAAGLAIFPGLVRYEEILTGEIRHAIRFTVPQTRNAYIWPARHKASSLTGTQYPPMGQRFRLNANFNISGYSATNQIILRALKKYGMILADNGSAWYMSGVPDERWNNSDLNLLRNVLGSNFEAVDESSLMIDVNSGQARQSAVSIAVTPVSSNVLVNAYRDFTASVTGSGNQSVTWLVNGIAGGNSTVGWISSIGRYQAPPVVPSPAVVSIDARSVADSTVVGSAAATVIPPPSITSLSPSPLNTGSFTLTVNGAGFQSGAVVNFNGVALPTTYVSAVRLTATGAALAANPGVPVAVTNPDSGSSNTVNVAVVSPRVTVTVAPANVTLKVSRTRQFSATVQNTTDQSVTWRVNGIAGGNAQVGVVTVGGFYRAPAAPGRYHVSATSKADASATGVARVTVVSN